MHCTRIQRTRVPVLGLSLAVLVVPPWTDDLNLSGWASVSYSIKGDFTPSLPAPKFCSPGLTSQMSTAMFPNPLIGGDLVPQGTTGSVATGCHAVGRGYCCWHRVGAGQGCYSTPQIQGQLPLAKNHTA